MSEKLADFIVENRMCSTFDNKIGRFYRPTKLANVIDRLASALRWFAGP